MSISVIVGYILQFLVFLVQKGLLETWLVLNFINFYSSLYNYACIYSFIIYSIPLFLYFIFY